MNQTLAESYNFNSNPFSILGDTSQIAQLTYLNFFTSPKDSHDFGNNAPTAILVPGWGCKKGSMWNLWTILKETMNVVYADDFPSINTCSLEEAAKLLEPTISRTILSKKNSDVILVWHSNGWLIALLSLYLATNLKVQNVVTMGTPHKWTPNAELPSLISASCRDINKNGWYLNWLRLSSQITKTIIALTANLDTIVPSENQVPSDSLVGKRKIKTIPMDIGHFDFIMWNKINQTAQIIEKLAN